MQIDRDSVCIFRYTFYTKKERVSSDTIVSEDAWVFSMVGVVKPCIFKYLLFCNFLNLGVVM